MQRTDRGGASGAIGDRWAVICAESLEDGGIATSSLRSSTTGTVAHMAVRLDHIPAIARIASRNQLQNPDFLMVGSDADRQVLWAADAKFSVDTARSRQVSGEVVSALLDLGVTEHSLLPALDNDVQILDGVFVCPDHPLTDRLLVQRRGPRRTTVTAEEVRLLPVEPMAFLEPLGQECLQAFLASLDSLPFARESSLVVALYYFRLARAALGCWQDQTAPLLQYHDRPVVDEDAIECEARALATMRTSAWGLILRWNDVAEEVRRRRTAVDHATVLPIRSRELRSQIEGSARAAGVAPPSSSRVRKVVGSWYRGRIREEFGPIPASVEDIGVVLESLTRYCRSLQPELAAVTAQVIEDLVTAPQADDSLPDTAS